MCHRLVQNCRRDRQIRVQIQQHMLFLLNRSRVLSIYYFILRLKHVACRSVRIRWHGRWKRQAVADQRTELHPLQDVRHKRPDSEHQLGNPTGRWRSGVRWHVTTRIVFFCISRRLVLDLVPFFNSLVDSRGTWYISTVRSSERLRDYLTRCKSLGIVFINCIAS